MEGLNFEHNGVALINFKTKQVIKTCQKYVREYPEKFKDFVYIDELIIEPIMKLNSGNFKTMYCCSGHPLSTCYNDVITLDYVGAYIMVDNYTASLLKSTIENTTYWELDDDNCIRIISTKFKLVDTYIEYDIDKYVWLNAIQELYQITEPIKNDFNIITMKDLL